MKKSHILYILFVSVVFLMLNSRNLSQENISAIPVDDPNIKKANQIIAKSLNAVGFDSSIKTVASLFVKQNVDKILFYENGEKLKQTSEIELNVELPNKIRKKEFNTFTTNQSSSTKIVNADKYFSEELLISNGVVKPMPKVPEIEAFLADKKARISDLKFATFSTLFPIDFDSSWYPLEFKYVGIAESDTGKADVIEAISSKATKYRLFFDQNSHLLLMMVRSWKNQTTQKEYERKTFYSEYQKKDGILIACQITSELNGEFAEKIEIVEVKINPIFKADFFDIKEK